MTPAQRRTLENVARLGRGANIHARTAKVLARDGLLRGVRVDLDHWSGATAEITDAGREALRQQTEGQRD